MSTLIDYELSIRISSLTAYIVFPMLICSCVSSDFRCQFSGGEL